MIISQAPNTQLMMMGKCDSSQIGTYNYRAVGGTNHMLIRRWALIAPITLSLVVNKCTITQSFVAAVICWARIKLPPPPSLYIQTVVVNISICFQVKNGGRSVGRSPQSTNHIQW